MKVNANNKRSYKAKTRGWQTSSTDEIRNNRQ